MHLVNLPADTYCTDSYRSEHGKHGSGPSSIQTVPGMQSQVKHFDIFIRTARRTLSYSEGTKMLPKGRTYGPCPLWVIGT